MGKVSKSLTRFKGRSPNQQHRRFAHRQRAREEKEDVKRKERLRLVEISQGEEERKDVAFVLEMPEDLQQMQQLLAGEMGEDLGKVKVALQRIRDYYSPEVDEGYRERHQNFILALVKYYLRNKEKQISEVILLHLKELCSEFPHVMVSLFQTKLTQLTQVFQTLSQTNLFSLSSSELEEQKSNLSKSVLTLLDMFHLHSTVLENPQTKIFSSLMQIGCQASILIQKLVDELRKNKLKSQKEERYLMMIMQACLEGLESGSRKYDPGVQQGILALIEMQASQSKLANLIDRYIDNIIGQLPAKQILGYQLLAQMNLYKAQFKNQIDKLQKMIDKESLTHLQLQVQKPKELPSFDPLIDEEFMLGRKKKKELDVKTAKKKIKIHQKAAIRELRKDTIQVQLLREKEREFRKKQRNSSVVRMGALKDEI